MKIQELLNNLTEAVSRAERTNRNLVNQFAIIELTFNEYAYNKLMKTIEALMCYDDNKDLSCYDIQVIFDLQKELFAIIQNTDLIPPHNPQGKFSILSLVLAQQLKEVGAQSNYKFLLPALKVFTYEILAIELNDTEIELNNIVISDDNTRIIPVKETLYYAQEEGIFNYTNLNSRGEIETLSVNEKSRVIHHSSFTKEYWATIERKLKITIEGASYGAALNRLCNSLLKGGAHGDQGGQETNCGADANIGIQNFFEWYSTLLAEEREMLNSRRANYLNHSLGDLLGRLARPSDSLYTNIIYCVEIIAGNIQAILRENDSLYDLRPHRAQESLSILIKEANEEVKIAAKKLHTAMASHNYPITVSYGSRSHIELFTTIAQLYDLHRYVKPEIRKLFYLHIDEIFRNKHIKHEDQFNLLQLVASNIEFSNFNQLRSILHKCAPTIGVLEAINILIKPALKLIASVEDLDNFMHLFVEKDYPSVIELILNNIELSLDNDENIARLEADKISRLINLLNYSTIQSLDKTLCLCRLIDAYCILTKQNQPPPTLTQSENSSHTVPLIPYTGDISEEMSDIIFEIDLSVDDLKKVTDILNCIRTEISTINNFTAIVADNFGTIKSAVKNILQYTQTIKTIAENYDIILAEAFKLRSLRYITVCKDVLNLYTENLSINGHSLSLTTKRLYAQQSFVARSNYAQPLLMDHLNRIKSLFLNFDAATPRCFICCANEISKFEESEYWIRIFSAVLSDHLNAAGISTACWSRDIDREIMYMPDYLDKISYSKVVVLLTKSLAQYSPECDTLSSRRLLDELSAVESKYQFEPQLVSPILISGSKESACHEMFANVSDDLVDARELGYMTLIEKLIFKFYNSANTEIEQEKITEYDRLWREFNEQLNVSTIISSAQSVDNELSNNFHKQSISFTKQDYVYLQTNSSTNTGATRPRYTI